jgi:hypothetical protein
MPPTPTDIRGRFETDLADTALQSLIDEATSEITNRFGPYRDESNPITVTLHGRRRRRIDLLRPLDETQADSIIITEYHHPWGWGETDLTLAADDYRVWWHGRTLQRLWTGTNPRRHWGERVDVTYVPVDDTLQRDEVAVKLVILGLNYQGVIDLKVGDVQTTYGQRSAGQNPGQSPLFYNVERDNLLKTLQPRRGLLLR